MTENQQDKKLQSFRQEIDSIDDQIIKLLQQRMNVVSSVTSLKKDHNEKFFIKSAREADMIKSLVARADKSLPKSLIVNLWRKIITASNMHEQPIKILVNKAEIKYLAREYYNEDVPLIEIDNISDLIANFAQDSAQIAAFDANKGDWWLNLSSNNLGLNIFAKAPLIKSDDENEIFLAAIKDPEKSESDNSLLVINSANSISQQNLEQILNKGGFRAKILQSIAQKNYLIELEGFYLEADKAISELKEFNLDLKIAILGHFANQIIT